MAPIFSSRTGFPWLLGTRYALALGLGLFLLSGSGLLGSGPTVQAAQNQRFAVPELDGGIAWLNTAKPLKLADLRGRIVVLDFWTLCCINCIHTLPDLAKLEAKYSGALVVIGVHTPKFNNEKRTESIRAAIMRYEIKHPVVNDANHVLWRRYGVRSWPTLVLIDPEGYYYKHWAGEGSYKFLDEQIGQLVKKYRAKKMLKEDPLDLELLNEQDKTPLYFPGKVLADAASNRLFIADSTNHRIVVTDLEGKKVAVAGTGVEGYKNGPFDQALFSDPQGMALEGHTLYVADRKNHVIRALDLREQKVTTVAGIGKQVRENRFLGGPALKTGMNSPWDLLLHQGSLFIAMAGHHQIWKLELGAQRLTPYAGNGAEELADGSLRESSFAQPSGLASDGQNLYVADSEISAIRALPLSGKGQVTTLVGEGLFEFGDVDGQGSKVRLQHALGVAYRDGLLYVADTYNGKIKIIDPAKRTCATFLGGTKEVTFHEPGGLSFAGDKLYLADTNAHRIQVIDMKTKTVSTLKLQGVEAPKRSRK